VYFAIIAANTPNTLNAMPTAKRGFKMISSFFLFTLLSIAQANDGSVPCGGVSTPADGLKSLDILKTCEDYTRFVGPSLQSMDKEREEQFEKAMAKELREGVEEAVLDFARLDQIAGFNGDAIGTGSGIAASCRMDNLKSTLDCPGADSARLSRLFGKDWGDPGSIAKAIGQKFLSGLTFLPSQELNSCLSSEQMKAIASVPMESELSNMAETLEKISKTTVSFKSLNKEFLDEMSFLATDPRLTNILRSDKARILFFNKFNQTLGSPLEKLKVVLNSPEMKQAEGTAIAERCDSVFSSLEKFVCGKPNALAISDPEFNFKYFDGYDPEMHKNGFDEYSASVTSANGDAKGSFIAHAYYCEAKVCRTERWGLCQRHNEKYGFDPEKLFSQMAINQNFEGQTNFANEKTNSLICSYLNCVNANGENKDGSCEKRVNPLSAKELKQKCSGDQGCDIDILRLMAFLEGKEKMGLWPPIKKADAAPGGSSGGSSSTNGSEWQLPERPYSEFAQNFLGATGDLIAEGKPLTLENLKVAEAKRQTTSAQAPAVRVSASEVQAAPAPATNTATQTSAAYLPSAPSSSRSAGPAPKRAAAVGQKLGAGRDEMAKTMSDAMKTMIDSMRELNDRDLGDIADSNVQYVPNPSTSSTVAAPSAAVRRRARSTAATPANYAATPSSDMRGSGQPQQVAGPEAENPLLARAIAAANKASGIASSGGASAPTKEGNNTGSQALLSTTAKEIVSLKASDLSEKGIDPKHPFVIRLVIEGKTVYIPVKPFSYKGQELLAPVLGEENKAYASLIFSSPIFAPYRQFETERRRIQKEFNQNLDSLQTSL
jgi:hypothetical protein